MLALISKIAVSNYRMINVYKQSENHYLSINARIYADTTGRQARTHVRTHARTLSHSRARSLARSLYRGRCAPSEVILLSVLYI